MIIAFGLVTLTRRLQQLVSSGMRAYIPYSLITFSPSNPWFDRACSSAIADREEVHRPYQASPSELTHATFISTRNRCSAKLRRACSSFRKRKIDKLNSSSTEKCFWSLSKKIFNNFCNSSFPSLIRPDGSIAGVAKLRLASHMRFFDL